MTTKEVLQECRLFGTLSDADLGRVAEMTSERDHEAGATIFQEGAAANELYLLQEGKVALQMTLPAGEAIKRVTIDIVTENQVFGWSAVVSPNVYTLTAVCLQRSRLLVIDGRRLSKLMEEDTSLGYQVMQGFIKVVASRLDDTRQVLLSERSVT
ncbi:MAG: cyclic nucleotide-binding domain-containing protein [Dehalococcoidales bacterium]